MAANPSGPLATRLVWLVVGIAALAAAMVGVILPLIPTTPFVILAAFAFMKSSSRLHSWLITHRIFGPVILDWREHGAISRPAKTIAIVSMAAIFLISLVLQMPYHVLVPQAFVLGVCAWFVGSRPAPPEQPKSG
jgi:uncharacterized membrane protein YbaN (DUF454 family)